METHQGCRLTLKTLSQNPPPQMTLVKVNPPHLVFDEQDWGHIELFKKNARNHGYQLVDYLKINQRGYLSLLQFEP